jgi:hypothetical protein
LLGRADAPIRSIRFETNAPVEFDGQPAACMAHDASAGTAFSAASRDCRQE